MAMLLFYLFLALIVSFTCSILEAILLSIPSTFLETVNKRKGYGKIIRNLKINVEKPLAAILTLNTAAHTIGAAGVGAQALILWGDEYTAVVSGVLTILILILTEIFPKAIGAYYWKTLIPFATYIIQAFIYITYPFVYFSEILTKLLVGKKRHTAISRDEILAMTALASKAHAITSREGTIIKNLLDLKNITAEKIMTPRNVLFSAPENITIEEFLSFKNVNAFTRTPIYSETLDMITGYVHKNDILNKLKDNQRELLLLHCKRNIITAGEETGIIKLFDLMIEQKEQISLIVDEFGGTAGIVTMEDIIETMLGIEILDEHDIDSDMQLLARNRYLRNKKH